MPQTPRASIVIPVHNDEDWVGASLDSCLAQTVSDIEVIVVDDASTDRTPAVVSEYAARDERIRLIRLEVNRSAFQARREGVMAASAPHILFLDGDDELAPEAVHEALSTAETHQADVVGFGVQVIAPVGMTVGRFQATLQPKYRRLEGAEIVPALFPVGEVAQGHLWRYLWATDLLRGAYEKLPADLELPRANDIPISFLALGAATRYVSTKARLYRYFWRRGVSGQQVEDTDGFEFYLGALNSIDSIREGVAGIAEDEDDDRVQRSYHSARLSIIQMILRYCIGIEDRDLRETCYAMLQHRAGSSEIILAAATFYPDALPFLAEHTKPTRDESSPIRNVLITVGNLQGGGVQAVVASQAKYLAAAGFTVTVAVRSMRGIVQVLPEGVDLVPIQGRRMFEKLESFIDICRERAIDAVIDHYVLYYDDWPYFALAARTLGVKTFGWLHNFALRPVFDLTTRVSYLTRYLPILDRVAVLSTADVAFWKLRGVNDVVAVPNPPSPLLLQLPQRSTPREAPTGPVRLVWWGRLQQHTKRVRSLIEIAAELRTLGIEFHLTIIGPDSPDLRAKDLREYAAKFGIADSVSVPGPMYGDDLKDALDNADLYVCTSAIEGYLLALVEAQALGLPVAMYDLPWLMPVQDNDGIVAAPQGDAFALAQQIASLVRDPAAYTSRSLGSLAAARRVLAHDFTELYSQLLTDSLPKHLSPEPTLEDAAQLLRLSSELQEDINGREQRRLARRDRQIAKLRDKVTWLRNQLDAERTVAYARDRELVKLRRKRSKSSRSAVPEPLRAERAREPLYVKAVRPIGRTALRIVPSLRPVARRVNRVLRRL